MMRIDWHLYIQRCCLDRLNNGLPDWLFWCLFRLSSRLSWGLLVLLKMLWKSRNKLERLLPFSLTLVYEIKGFFNFVFVNIHVKLFLSMFMISKVQLGALFGCLHNRPCFFKDFLTRGFLCRSLPTFRKHMFEVCLVVFVASRLFHSILLFNKVC